MHRLNALLVTCLIVAPTIVRSEATLSVISWGGPYQDAQQETIFTPFEKKTGIKIIVRSYDGDNRDLISRGLTENWDVIDMTEEQAREACDAGLLHALKPENVAVASTSTTLNDDFVADAFNECSVAQNLYSTVMAFDESAFAGVKPTRIEDFFDPVRFPGKRAIQKLPDVALEWALVSQGIPGSQVYDLLSTDRGLRLAFRQLDVIRDLLVWWENPASPVEMLMDGRATMASGYNGRFFSATVNDDARISIVWDAQIIGYEVWAISSSSKDKASAEKFLRFATAPEQLAAVSNRIPYGPSRHSAFSRIGRHPKYDISMRDHLPNAPQHLARAIVRDSQWYARTAKLRKRRFDAWLAREHP